MNLLQVIRLHIYFFKIFEIQFSLFFKIIFAKNLGTMAFVLKFKPQEKYILYSKSFVPKFHEFWPKYIPKLSNFSHKIQCGGFQTGLCS